MISARLILLFHKCDGGILLSPELCQLLSYWRALGCTESAPDRSLLDLRQLTNLLSWMFILEMSNDGSLRYRLAGSSLEEAFGCGMSGKAYADIFKDHSQASVMEELYAVALVQSSGIVRTGAFTLDAADHELEVLVLPFAEPRAMGGTILVGVIRPFDVLNQGFLDRWGSFQQDLASLFVVPGPRVVTQAHLSERVSSTLQVLGVELRALDVEATLQLDRQRAHFSGDEVIPSESLMFFESEQTQDLN